MKIKDNRLFPYPILMEGNENFVSSKFKVEAEYRHNELEYEFILKVSLNEQNLINLLQTGNVSLVCHLECSKTKFRRIEGLKLGKNEFKIEVDSIDGRLELITFILAKSEIKDYHSKNFDSEYGKKSFFIPRGGILGIAEMPALFIENKKENYSKLPTIFDISSSEDENRMKLGLNGDRIKITIPIEKYKIWNAHKDALHSRNILNTMIVFPALVGILNELTDKDALSLYGNKRWFGVIHQKLQGLGYDLEKGDLNDEQIFYVAQELLEELFSDAMDSLRYLEESNE